MLLSGTCYIVLKNQKLGLERVFYYDLSYLSTFLQILMKHDTTNLREILLEISNISVYYIDLYYLKQAIDFAKHDILKAYAYLLLSLNPWGLCVYCINSDGNYRSEYFIFNDDRNDCYKSPTCNYFYSQLFSEIGQ